MKNFTKWDFEKLLSDETKEKLIEYWYNDEEMTEEEISDDFNRNYGNSYFHILRDIFNTIKQ